MKFWVNSVVSFGVHSGGAIGVTFKVLCDHKGTFLVSLKHVLYSLGGTGIFCGHFDDTVEAI